MSLTRLKPNSVVQVYDFAKERDFMARVDNTLQHKKNIEVFQTAGINSLAYTNRKNIWINFQKAMKKANNNYDQFLMLLKGLNYHELAHCLYTKYNAHARFAQELNMLEDQRIETLFSTKYPKSLDYFKSILNGFVLEHMDNPVQQKLLYALVYGRRLILQNKDTITFLRKHFNSKFGETKTVTVEKIVDEYLVTTDVPRQKELAKQLYNILQGNNPPQPSGRTGGSQTGKSTGKDEKELTEKAGKQLKEQDKQEQQQSQGTGQSEPTSTDVKKQLEQQAQATKEKLDEDIQQQKKAMDKQGFGKSEIDTTGCYHGVFTADKQHKDIAKKVEEQIKRLRNDLGNQTTYNQRRGKVNVRKALVAQPTDMRIFKRFLPSRMDKTKMSVTMLVDGSGSMLDNQFDIVMGTAWSIAEACERVGSVTQVYEFSNSHRMVKTFDQDVSKGKWGREYQGGTRWFGAAKAAYKNIEHLKKTTDIKQHVFIVLTDGGYCMPTESEREVLMMKKHGVFTAILGVNANILYCVQDRRVFDIIKDIPTFNKVPEVVTDLVNSIQARVAKDVRFGK